MTKEKPWYVDNALVNILVFVGLILGFWFMNRQSPVPKPDVRFQTNYLQGSDGTVVPYTTIIDNKTGERSPLIFRTQ